MLGLKLIHVSKRGPSYTWYVSGYQLHIDRYFFCPSGWCCYQILIRWSRDKMAAIFQTIFSNAFSWMKSFSFQTILIKMCSLWSNWQYVIIGSDIGLLPNRRQAIIWTNDGLVYRRIYAWLGLNGLSQTVFHVKQSTAEILIEQNHM